MDKNKLVLPIIILLGCIILGGFYYTTQVSKQRSIEKQQQIELRAGQEEKQIRKECFSEAEDYKNSIIKAESDYINSGGRITRADYDKIFDDTYQKCLLKNGLPK